MSTRVHVSFVLMAFVLGLMLALQFKIINRGVDTVPYDRAQQLNQELKTLEKECAALEAEASDLEKKLAQANKGYMYAEQALKSELEKVKKAAGLLPVSGPGIRIVMKNIPLEKKTEYQHLFTIRDEDILRVINELKGAGAKALSINGQRIMATTEIRLAGSFINVNTVRILPPYEIIALGDPSALRSALEIEGGLVDYFQDWGILLMVEELDNVTVPAYKGDLEFKYAKPVKEGE